MNKLAKSLLVGLLENESEVVALYGGGFKPPTKGHFEVAQRTLQEHPEITKLYIVIGSGVRNNITTDESLSIWSIYKKYLSDKIEIVTTQSPLKYIKNYLENNPEGKTYVVLGTREGNESDIKDFTQRKEFFEKYGNNIDVLNIVTGDEVSGTKARKAATQSKEEFLKYIPDQLTDDEKTTAYNAVLSVIKEDLTPNSNFNYHLNLKDLTGYMIGQGLKIQPLPKVKIISNDVSNANDFFGKTAYYNPDKCEIVLFTCNRHPKDIMRSFAHEMIHHAQNLEGRIGGGKIQTTNTHEDGYLRKIEAEAFLHGNMLFRGWTDSAKVNRLHESLSSNSNKKILKEDEEDTILSYPSTFKSDTNILVVFKEDENYKELKPLFDEYGYGFYSPENKMIILDGEVFINSDLNFQDLKFVEAHEIAHLLLRHTGPYSEDDEMDADLGAYILLKKKGLSTEKLEDQFKYRHGIDFDENLLERVKNLI